MKIVTEPIASAHDHDHESSGRTIYVEADRLTLAKRRWSATAEDGTEFGFDLSDHLHDGDLVFQDANARYLLRQAPEPVLEIPLGETLATARIAWSLGNLHFPIELTATCLRVIDDSAIRLYLERDHIAFTSTLAVFHPAGVKTHSHAHDHHH